MRIGPHIRIYVHICAYMREYLLLAQFGAPAWPSLILTTQPVNFCWSTRPDQAFNLVDLILELAFLLLEFGLLSAHTEVTEETLLSSASEGGEHGISDLRRKYELAHKNISKLI